MTAPANPTVVTVSRGIRNADLESLRIRDVSPQIIQKEPDVGPIVTMSAKVGMKPTSDPKVEWPEDQLLPKFDTLAADVAAGDVTITVSNYLFFRKGDLLKLPSGEVILVTATPSSATVSVKRAIGSTGAGTATSGSNIFIFSSCNEEGAGTRDLLTTQKVMQYNLCQILRHPFGYTETINNTGLYGGREGDNQRLKALLEHKRQIENAAIHGERSELTGLSGQTQTQRTMNGVLAMISTNVVHLGGGTLTEDEWENFLRICFRYQMSPSKYVFLSPKAIQVVNGFARGKLQPTEVDGSYGVTVTEYKNSGRKVKLHEHRELTNNDLTDLSGIAGMAFLVDPKALRMRYLKGRLTVLKPNIQANDVDGRKDEYISECTIELHQESMHGKIDGIVS